MLPNSGFKIVYDHIHLLIPLNQSQYLTIVSILDNTIKNRGKRYLDLDLQLLIYIRVETGIKKSRVIKVIEMKFTLYIKKRELVIFIYINFVANSLVKNIVYIILKVYNKAKKIY